MSDNINEWINSWKKILNYNPNEKRIDKKYFNRVVPRVVCNDGFIISIQASNGHYCNPRNILKFDEDDSSINHTSFELGFPTSKDDLIMEYAEEKDKPTDTVYGWVRLEVVKKLIEKHKGIDYRASLKRFAEARTE